MSPMLSVLNRYVKDNEQLLLDNVQMTLHDRLLEVLNDCGLKQAELARRLHVSRATVSQWKNGITSPEGDNLFNLAEVTGYNFKWLRDGTGSKYDYLIKNDSEEYRVELKTGGKSVLPKKMPNIANMLNVATPRTYKALIKLEEAYAAGMLTQDDLELLDAIARRLTHDKSRENS